MNEKPLTVKEAAPLLGLSPASVYALCATRQLRHRRVGPGAGKIMIPPEAVEEYNARATVDSTAGSPAPGKHHGVKTFANLDPERLLAAWKKQGKA